MQKQHAACRLFLEPESFDDVASAIFQSGSLSRNDFAHTECRENSWQMQAVVKAVVKEAEISGRASRFTLVICEISEKPA